MRGIVNGSERVRIRSSWPAVWMRGRLTDRKIAAYEREGWYSAGWREYRRERWQKRSAKAFAGRVPVEERLFREGNFVREADGRLVYAPV